MDKSVTFKYSSIEIEKRLLKDRFNMCYMIFEISAAPIQQHGTKQVSNVSLGPGTEPDIFQNSYVHIYDV